MPSARAPKHLGDGLVTFAVALAARLAAVAWAGARIPPAADGVYYQRIAERISQGLGYTWLWPDGAVTYAAHYPVGYPALVGAVYAVTGPRPVAAMVLNAVLGALAAFAAHRLATRAVVGIEVSGHAQPPTSAISARRLALAAGLLVALHPSLVAYTPALMTEGATAALVTCAAAVAAWARGRPSTVAPAAAIGVIAGIATLVRPQSLLLAPVFGLLAAVDDGGAETPPNPPALEGASSVPEGAPSVPEDAASGRLRFLRRAAATAIVATLAALLVCAPWTARNCVRMKRCALVSVNGGWNLLIGADAISTGAWSPVKVPDACREVFDEAEKDACFGREARRYIREHPATWLSLVPRKLAATFDLAGASAAPSYLHEANAAAFPWQAQRALGGVALLYERIVLLFALGWAARRASPAEREELWWVRMAVAVAGGGFAFVEYAWPAYVALAVAALLRGRSLWRGPVLAGSAIAVLAATLATHAVFFGAGRYAMVALPLLTALAPLALARPTR